jgi:hypothetical protein
MLRIVAGLAWYSRIPGVTVGGTIAPRRARVGTSFVEMHLDPGGCRRRKVRSDGSQADQASRQTGYPASFGLPSSSRASVCGEQCLCADPGLSCHERHSLPVAAIGSPAANVGAPNPHRRFASLCAKLTSPPQPRG